MLPLQANDTDSRPKGRPPPKGLGWGNLRVAKQVKRH